MSAVKTIVCVYNHSVSDRVNTKIKLMNDSSIDLTKQAKQHAFAELNFL